jgi:hypothetical protein
MYWRFWVILLIDKCDMSAITEKDEVDDEEDGFRIGYDTRFGTKNN